MNTKYSFLLPAYKAKFLEEALRSIQAQTCQDFKVLVSDDCSPDNLQSIFDRVCGDDPRFSFRRNEQNIGGKSLVAHWNLLVDMCDTEYLILASDDDVYAPTFLEEIDKLAIKYPEVNLIHARAQLINENDEIMYRDEMYEEKVSQIEFMAFLGKQNHVACIANQVYKTEHIKRIGGYVDLPLAWGSDAMTNNLMAQNGVASTSDILFNFRWSGLNISTLKDKAIGKKKVHAALLFYKELNQLLTNIKQENTKLFKHNFQVAKNSQMQVVYTNVFNWSFTLGFKDFIRCMRYLAQERILCKKYDIYVLWKSWMVSRIKHS